MTKSPGPGPMAGAAQEALDLNHQTTLPHLGTKPQGSDIAVQKSTLAEAGYASGSGKVSTCWAKLELLYDLQTECFKLFQSRLPRRQLMVLIHAVFNGCCYVLYF